MPFSYIKCEEPLLIHCLQVLLVVVLHQQVLLSPMIPLGCRSGYEVQPLLLLAQLHVQDAKVE